MKLLIDENIPLSLAKKLLKLYPNSIYVLDSNLKGSSDQKIYEFAQKENFIIITFDTDFADIITYPLENSARIILRFKQFTISEITNLTVKALKKLEDKNLKNSIIIVSKEKIRIKRLPE